jgi:hypothetical protein
MHSLAARKVQANASKSSVCSCPGLSSEEWSLVPRRGLEPPQCCHRQDLNLVRLPIPPSRHTGVRNLMAKPPIVK